MLSGIFSGYNIIQITDLLHELENGKWLQKISSYFKTRVSRESKRKFLEDAGFEFILDKPVNGIIHLIGEKI
jgi:hypothetical protein